VIGRHKFCVGKKFWSWKFSTFNNDIFGKFSVRGNFSRVEMELNLVTGKGSSMRIATLLSSSQLRSLTCLPGDLGTRKRPGTSCKIEIHFWFKITEYLINGIRFLSQICPRYSFPCARQKHKVSNSFTKESGRDKWLNGHENGFLFCC
jgi:hypothetical protein